MPATRFYFPIEGSGTPNISPAYDGGWEQTGQATRLKLLVKRQLSTLQTLTNTGTKTVPITTTQDILANQFVSDPIPAQRLDASCLFSLVIRVLESATTANVTLACVVKIVDSLGVSRGTIYSTFNIDTEYPTTAATRKIPQTAITAITTKPGDRIVVEIGGHAAAPTAATTFTHRYGFSAASDFALTSALTTDLNPWCEFSVNLDEDNFENYRGVDAVSAGIISVGERIR